MVEDETVAVVTINWNGWRSTLDCLGALRASRGARWHLYVVDNGSTDDSLLRLRNLGPDVTLIEAGFNGGWTGGNNAGLRRALADGHMHLFILNNDAFVESETIMRLMDVARGQSESARPALLGPIHKGSGEADYDFISATVDRRTGVPRWMSPDEIGVLRGRLLIETAYISGAAIFAHRRHFDAIGFLDDRFYLNFDDTDWCTRAARAGFPLLMVRDAVINHVGSASIGGRRSPLQTYFLTRNRLLFAEKHCTWRERLWLLKRTLGQGRTLAGGGAPWSWVFRLAASRAVAVSAFRRALIDYAFRRFGDCPPQIRRWNAEYAA